MNPEYEKANLEEKPRDLLQVSMGLEWLANLEEGHLVKLEEIEEAPGRPSWCLFTEEAFKHVIQCGEDCPDPCVLAQFYPRGFPRRASR